MSEAIYLERKSLLDSPIQRCQALFLSQITLMIIHAELTFMSIPYYYK